MPCPVRVGLGRAPAAPGGLSSRWTSTARHRAARRPPAPCARAASPCRKLRRSLVWRPSSALGDHIGHQPLLSRRVFPSQDDDVAHGRMLAERGLDFSEFDAEAADLHLVVGTAEELDVPVGQIAGQIAGFVQPCSGLGAEGVGNEFLGGQIRPVEIAAGHACAANIQLTLHADRDRTQKRNPGYRSARWRWDDRS